MFFGCETRSQMKTIPFILILLRLIFAVVFPVLVWLKWENAHVIIAILVVIGLITDIFDGIIARKLGVDTKKIRIWDSNVDVIFWISGIASTFYLRWDIIKPIFWLIMLVVAVETLAYVVSFVKFKRTIATHTILAKFWTLTLLVFLLEALIFNSTYSFYVCFILGVLSRIEIILIILILKEWTTDIPSIFAVGKINRGEPVKKSSLFNS